MPKRKHPKTDADFFAPLIVRHATDSMVFTDPDGLTLWANEPFSRMSGYTSGELIGKKPGAVLQGTDTDAATVARISTAIKMRQTIRTELLNYTKSGAPYWFDLTITPVYDDRGSLTHFMSIERDITESKLLAEQTAAALAAEQMQRQERRTLLKVSEWLFSAQNITELREVVTRSMSKLFPGTDGALYIFSNSRDVLERTGGWGAVPDDPHLKPVQCWALRRGRAFAYGMSDIDLSCSHGGLGDTAYFCLPIIAHSDTIGLLHISYPDLAVAALRDTTCAQAHAQAYELALICAEQISLAAANVRLQTELQDRSVKDPLTGLWNRRWFMDMAQSQFQRARADGSDYALIMLDVDHFKRFNDVYGHDAGDLVLKMLADSMSKFAVGNVFACRLGGEEFAIICNDMDPCDAEMIYERMRQDLANMKIVNMDETLPAVTISAGIAKLANDEDLGSLMRRADTALYTAKSNGRDRAEFSPEHDAGPAAIQAAG